MAPLALANLHTKASLSALAGMLLTTPPGTYETYMAAKYLGETHDPAWFPVLLEFADQHGAWHLADAAQSGGETAVPALLARLKSSDPNIRNSAINALGYTGSRAAVPILINLLAPSFTENAAVDTATHANLALAQLTHLSADRNSDGASRANWHARWQQWWLANASSATIYKSGGCPGDKELP